MIKRCICQLNILLYECTCRYHVIAHKQNYSWKQCLLFYYLHCVIDLDINCGLVTFVLPKLPEVCPFGHVYEYAETITTGVLPQRFSCQANFRFQGATEVNFTFVSHDIEPNKDAIWLEAGFFADSSNDSGALDSGDLVKQPTLTFKDAGSNYWIEIFTDETDISGGLTLEISAGKFITPPPPLLPRTITPANMGSMVVEIKLQLYDCVEISQTQHHSVSLFGATPWVPPVIFRSR